MILIALLACPHFYTVRSLTQVSPGGGEREFYAVVRNDHYENNVILASDATLIRCTTEDAGATAETTCAPVLTSSQAFNVVDGGRPITFSALKSAPTGAAKTTHVDSTVSLAASLLRKREELILSRQLTAAQAATVRAQAMKEACEMIATVTDRPCAEVLRELQP